MAMSTTRKVVLTIGGILLGLVLIVVVGIAIIVSALRGNRPIDSRQQRAGAENLRLAA